jgi:hypothetical protein
MHSLPFLVPESTGIVVSFLRRSTGFVAERSEPEMPVTQKREARRWPSAKWSAAASACVGGMLQRRRLGRRLARMLRAASGVRTESVLPDPAPPG